MLSKRSCKAQLPYGKCGHLTHFKMKDTNSGKILKIMENTTQFGKSYTLCIKDTLYGHYSIWTL